MPRPKNEPKSVEEPVSEPVHPATPIVFVTVVLVLAVAVVASIMAGGRLFVTVDVVEGAHLESAPMVCVYEGDVSAQIESGRVADMPQAIAAVMVKPGAEVELSGHWKGTYTLAVIGANDERFPGTDTIVCQVDSGETRIVFNYCPLSGEE